LAGTVSSVRTEEATAVVTVKGLEIHVAVTPEMATGREVLFFIRPNDVELLPASHESGTNVFDGVVDKMTYLGDRSDYRICVGESLELRVQTDGKVRFDEGENVKVHLPIPHCRVIVE
jgi:ABC-type Fe3+/spermidine/putrescine transport system ATPase subunit